MVRPRYASTVVLLRPDESGGFAVLLTRRPPQMRFLGGYYVFPGGTVHEQDHSPNVLERCTGLSGEEAQKILGNRHETKLALGHWVAGIREMFEEVGVLLCNFATGGAIDLRNDRTRERLEAERKAILKGELTFGEFLEAERLCCDLSLLTYFFHRVTPEIYPMRFDTRFYLTTLPAHQIPLERSEEVTESLWIKPEEAISQAYQRDFPILPPTTTVLEDLARVDSWGRLCNKYRLL